MDTFSGSDAVAGATAPAILDAHDEDYTAEHEDHAPLLDHERIHPGRVTKPVNEIPYSPIRSSPSDSSFEDIFYPEADTSDPDLHHFPTHHEGILSELQRTRRKFDEDVADEAPATPSPSSKQMSSSRLPSLTEAFEEVVPTEQSKEQDNQPALPRVATAERWYNHSHGPAHHHERQHKQNALIQKQERAADVEANPPRLWTDFKELLSGLGLAIIVAALALALYKSGLFVSHDAVKDGGAVLGG